MEFRDMNDIREAGFEGFLAIHELQHSKPICSQVPKQQGIYLVLRPDAIPPGFLDSVQTPAPPYTIAELEQSWVRETVVMYIGKAGGDNKETLRSRLRRYMRFGKGKNSRHTGGKAIWQLIDSSELLVCWKPIRDANPKQVEENLIEQFRAIYGARPFANKI